MDLKKKMKAFFTFKRRANDGFTLVELIVVIAILAILGGVAIPVYSGYVAKAEAAADEQLLAAVNTAFVSACLASGESNTGRTDVKTLGVDANGKVTNVGSSQKINETFEIYFAGNEDAAFKVNKSYVYDNVLGVFRMSGMISFGNYSVNEEDYYSLLGSSFGTMSGEFLMGKVDQVIDWVGDFNGEQVEGLVADVMTNDDYLETLYAMAGGKDKYESMDAAKKQKAQLTALVLHSADRSAEMDANTLSSKIYENSGGYIKYGDNDTGLNIAATATSYAMGLAFAESLSESDLQKYTGYTSVDQMGVEDIFNLMDYHGRTQNPETGKWSDNETSEFQNWMKENDNGKADISGYLGAMGVLSDNKDKLDTEKLLEEGFNNNEFTDLINQALGRTN